MITRPACHAWEPMRPVEIGAARMEIRSVIPHLEDQAVDLLVLARWQNGLCALCGRVELDERRLIHDHCHTSGMLRGLLCGSCNSSEWRRSFRIECDARYAYRELPPTRLLWMAVPYKGLHRFDRVSLEKSVYWELAQRAMLWPPQAGVTTTGVTA